MKLIRYRRDEMVRVGVVEGQVVRPAGASIVAAEPGLDEIPLADLELLAPTSPTKVICVGLNYADHAEEAGQPVPESPMLFAKLPNSIVGPGAAIEIPSFTSEVDYEAELGIVISKTARKVSVDAAGDHVLGYTCVNDVSARDLQFADGQWTRGKSLDTFCPVGPWIVTRDEIADPHDLRIGCRLNGESMQDSTTSQMVFGVEELVNFISQAITLEPGDLIATGTPPGVGFSRKPPVYLSDGDTVEVEIEGIATLTNPVVAVG